MSTGFDVELFPVRVRTGAHKGELAAHWRVLRTLHNPRYAGAFAYGRRRERLAAGGTKTLDTVPREQWIALIARANRDAVAGSGSVHANHPLDEPARIRS